MRINNLEFGKCSYLGNPPEYIGWEIRKWFPNENYGKEKEFIKDGDFYRPNDECYNFVKLHKSCFANPEFSIQVAAWHYNQNEYEFTFCADRPLDLNTKEREDFWKLVEYGFKQLNPQDYETFDPC